MEPLWKKGKDILPSCQELCDRSQFLCYGQTPMPLLAFLPLLLLLLLLLL
jgi:hypothetical protein